MKHPHPDLLGLGIQQPWAELILRGIKTIEIRNVPVQPKGPIYLYTGQKLSPFPAALAAAERYHLDVESLPRGRVVGTVHILESRPAVLADVDRACVPAELLLGRQSWLLADPQRCPEPLLPQSVPYGMWFYPFRRQTART